jgi:hypothetical protein
MSLYSSSRIAALATVQQYTGKMSIAAKAYVYSVIVLSKIFGAVNRVCVCTACVCADCALLQFSRAVLLQLMLSLSLCIRTMVCQHDRARHKPATAKSVRQNETTSASTTATTATAATLLLQVLLLLTPSFCVVRALNIDQW